MSLIGVTGPKGLLGSTLTITLGNGGHTIFPIAGDVRDADGIDAEIQRYSPEWVVHTAAITDVASCESDKSLAMAVNAEGTNNVVKAAAAIGARFMYISTASVFDGMRGDYKETDEPHPLNVYSESKVRGEKYVEAYSLGSIVRLNLMGVHPLGSHGKNFMEWLIDSIRDHRNMSLFSDARINALSNWSIANMIGEIISLGVDKGIFHLGTRDVASKSQIGELVATYFPEYRGTLSVASVDSIRDGVLRPKEMWLNCDYTVRLLGITMPSMSEEIDRIIAKLRA